MFSLDPYTTSIYSSHAHKWIHQVREPVQAEALSLYAINDIETLIRPSRAARQTLFQTRARKWWSRCLSQDVPEMGAALGFIGDLLEESHVLSTHGELLDPSIGRLMAFGKALDVENKSTRLLDVAAYAAGPIGADLRVGAVTERVLGVDGARGLALGVPTVFEGGDVVWSWGGAIRQVVFAGEVGGGAKSNLAVRTAGGTTILRQTRLQSPLTSRSHPFAATSLVDVDMGESVHAHVEFNPWYERQFAIIDESGKWRIWDIEGRPSRDSRIRKGLGLVEYSSGRISHADDEAGKGWGRIMWGGDLNTIMACDRKRAGLFDIRSPESTNPNIPIPTNPGWVLDLQHAPSSENHRYDAFVLTSTALTWVDIRQSGKPLMNVPHYRHRDDHALCMEFLDTNDTTITALLHSRSNTLVTMHRFSPSETPTVLGTPKLIPSPIPADTTTPVSYGVSILPCRLFARGKTDEAAGRYLADTNLRFFTSFGVGKELDVTQRLYASMDLLGAAAPTGGFKLVSKATKGVGARGRSSCFVVEDDVNDDDEMEVEMRGLSFDADEDDTDTTFVEFGNPCVGDRNISTWPRTDLGDIYKYAFTADQGSLKTASDSDAQNSIDASVRQLKALLQKRIDRGDLGIISLLNLRQPAQLYNRLDELETRIRDLLRDDALAEYNIKSLIPASTDEFFTHAHSGDSIAPIEELPIPISILPLYTKLVETWVHPLPDTTPSKVRLRRERLCRMIATEMWLSSIGLHLEPTAASLPSPPKPRPPEIDESVPPEYLPEPLQRIRTYANVSARITLPERLQGALDKWEVGGDPWEHEYTPDEAGIKKRSYRRKGAARRPDAMKLREDVETWSSQLATQPPAITVSSQAPQSQSSQVEAVVTSQVERGKHGGRVAPRKKRKTGF